MIAVVGALAAIWVLAWVWRVRRGYLDDAESRSQRIVFWLLVGGMPLMWLALSVWLLTHDP